MDGFPQLCWDALSGPLSPFAERHGDAVRLTGDVGMFGAVERFDRSAWEGITELTRRHGLFLAFQPGLPSTGHPALREVFRGTTLQMALPESTRTRHTTTTTVDGFQIADLDAADHGAMLALADATKPGPFFARTAQLGRFLGVRNEAGDLIAMAGERLRADRVVEISAVCTHPAARTRGLGAALTMAVAERIRHEGCTPVLHVIETNANAARLYAALGFEAVLRFDVVGLAPCELLEAAASDAADVHR